ncbi:MAG TPA: PAS domain S-box protein, partial [Terriglobales bacterium]
MWVYDIETLRFLAVNDTAVVRYGFSREEFLAMTILDIRLDQGVAKLRGHMANRLPMVSGPEMWRHRTKSGALIDVEIASHDLVLEGRLARIVVAYDITDRKRAEEGLLRFRMAMETSLDGIFIMDFKTFRYLDVNETGCKMLGYSRDELLAMRTMDVNPNLTEADQRQRFEQSKALGSEHVLKEPDGRLMRRKDGSTFPIEVARRYLSIGSQEIVVGIARDITERKEAEFKIDRLNRVYAVLSGINAAIVRIRNRRELFQEVCRIIVESGRFTLGWVAILNQKTGKLTAVAQAGLPESSDADTLLFDDTSGLVPWGAAEVAIRERRAAVDNAIEDVPALMEGEHASDTLAVRRVAIALGAKSVIVLPLIVEGRTFGILTLYAPERDFFDAQELKLLNELAGDVSFGLEFIAKEEKVDFLAYYDALTGLPNRSLFSERLGQQLHTRADSPDLVALVLMDVERLRMVNDTMGRQAGDEALRLIARRLEVNAPTSRFSNPARVVADCFGVIIRARDASELAQLLEEGMRACYGTPFVIEGKEVRLVARAGISIYPRDGLTAESLLKNAEAALRNAKQTTERFVFYAPEMTAQVAEILAMETKLRSAIELEQFVLHYQPKFEVLTGKITGVEALIRWNDPDTGMVPPLKFISILEETGMIFEVGRWALRQALADQQRWRG